MSWDIGAVGVEEGFLLLSNKQLVDEKLCRQVGSTSSHACSSQYILVERDIDLQFTAETRRKDRDCGRQADGDVEWQWKVHEHDSSKCRLLSCLYCNEKVDDSAALNDLAVGEMSSTESRSAQLLSLASGALAINCTAEGFNHWHVNERMSQYNQQHTTQPVSSPCASQTASSRGHNQQPLTLAHLSSRPSFNCIGDQVLLCQRSQSAPPPHVVLSNMQNHHYRLQQKSFEGRSIGWSKDIDSGNSNAKPEKLGAALCHSQTRARNAEKVASDALMEKEKLAKLIIREANTCRRYKKKIHLLELENLWLKAHVAGNSGIGCELPSSLNASASRHCKFYRRGFSKDSSSVPGTVGLAFALGLSCASAGFVLGCCMGLIGLSH